MTIFIDLGLGGGALLFGLLAAGGGITLALVAAAASTAVAIPLLLTVGRCARWAQRGSTGRSRLPYPGVRAVERVTRIELA